MDVSMCQVAHQGLRVKLYSAAFSKISPLRAKGDEVTKVTCAKTDLTFAQIAFQPSISQFKSVSSYAPVLSLGLKNGRKAKETPFPQNSARQGISFAPPNSPVTEMPHLLESETTNTAIQSRMGEDTRGCKMHVSDLEKVLAITEDAGCRRLVDRPNGPETSLFNSIKTCAMCENGELNPWQRLAVFNYMRMHSNENFTSFTKIWYRMRKIAANVTTQIIRHSEMGIFGDDARARMLNLVVSGSVLGLLLSSKAWAGPEVAQLSSKSIFDLDDIQSGFASSFLLIFFSEIGDKTFFIAALLATRKPGIAVFSGTLGALAIMTLISVFLGRIFHYIDGILPSFGDKRLPVDDIAAVILLVYFGVSTLLDASSMEESDSGGEQKEAELAIAGIGGNGAIAGTVVATFALVFVAEWGDKSFFSTIALAAASSPIGVVTGAIAGHGAATLLAVLGGSFLGTYISEKTIAYIGGILFLVFAGITLVEIIS